MPPARAALILWFCAACVPTPDVSNTPSRAGPVGQVVMAPGGILVAGLAPVPGQGSEISFGRTETSTLRAMTALVGRAPADVSDMPQCDAEALRLASWPRDGLFLLFQNGDFQGWSVTDTKFSATGGLRIGQTAAELQNSDATIRATQFGPEVRLNGVTGYVDDKGKVSSLSAGETCFR